MNGFLLDTSVVSAFAPGKPPIPMTLANWMRQGAEALFVPAIAMAEIEQGIRKLHRAGGIGRAQALSIWLDRLLIVFANHVLPVDADVARAAGALSETATAVGRHPGLADILIAATAEVHGLELLTRNMRHFEPLGINPIDPFDDMPAVTARPPRPAPRS